MKKAGKFVNELLKGNPDLAHLDPTLIRSALRQFSQIYPDDKHKIIRAAATALAKLDKEGVVGVYREIERCMGTMYAEKPDENNSQVVTGKQRKRRMEKLCRKFKHYFPQIKDTEDSFLAAVLEQCEDIYLGNKWRVFIVAAIAVQLCSNDNYQAYRDELAKRTRERELAIQASGNGFLQLTSWFNPDLRARMRY